VSVEKNAAHSPKHSLGIGTATRYLVARATRIVILVLDRRSDDAGRRRIHERFGEDLRIIRQYLPEFPYSASIAARSL
jgi:hypothetical protein